VYEIKQSGKFKYIEEGEGEPLILLHDYFVGSYKVVVPILPLFELDLLHTSVSGLQKHLHKFIELKDYHNINLLGNSLGGHIALVHVLKHPARIKSLILTGSSGLYENGMGDTYPKRGDYEYIKKKTEDVFFDPKTATKELIDEVFDIVNNRIKVIKVLALAKSAIRNNLGKELNQIKQPTLLIWGANDKVTPPFVGEEFKKLIPNSELHFIDQCGHAPMMEVPDAFNRILLSFLQKNTQPAI